MNTPTKAKTIRLNDRWSLDRDAHNWLLRETYMGADKDGNPKEKVRTTYHRDLSAVARWILNHDSKECQTAEELAKLFEAAARNVAEYLMDLTE